MKKHKCTDMVAAAANKAALGGLLVCVLDFFCVNKNDIKNDLKIKNVIKIDEAF